GYAGNGTVRAWKNFEGIYHNVFASMNGKFTGGLNYGRSHVFVPEGLLLRPRSPETQNGNPPAQGPSPTFSMPLRELPRSGMFQLTVEAARYDDGFQPSSELREAENWTVWERTDGGLDGVDLGENIALGGIATQSSVGWGGAPGRAIDGNAGGAAGTATHTNGAPSWWEVDLLDTYDIDTIRLWNRLDCCSERLTNFTITVLDAARKVNYERAFLTDNSQLSDTNFTAEGLATEGQFVRISLPRAYLSLAEVEVFAGGSDDPFVPSAPITSKTPEYAFELDVNGGKGATLEIPDAGVYQLDVVLEGQPRDDVMVADIGQRTFSRRLKGKFSPGPEGQVIIPFLVARFAKGAAPIKIGNGAGKNLRRVHVTPVSDESEQGRQFAAFEKRAPTVSAHIGVRTDVGPRFTRVNQLRAVPSAKVERYSFRAPISSFPSPETEEGNANYLAGLWEIAIRSEPSGDRQVPRLLLSAVEFEGPFYETWPPRGHRQIFIPSKRKGDPPAYAREVLERFASRAFRRPVAAKELASLLAVWRESYARKQDFQQSVKDALLVALTSPQFLFIVEESAGPQAEPLSPYELAAKLSYFLWNTTPDEKLLELAASGKLGDVVASEVDRLVADDRFLQFAGEFVSQWLSLDKFDVVNINHGTFPRLNRETRRELRKEPVRFVAHLIQGNFPLRNLIDSDFILANEVVASYYGIGGGAAQGFDFVPVRHGGKALGGVLTQAAILSGLSDGHESNPVKRGAWLARKIIAEPPDPPPPNVPALEKEAKGKTLRERLEQHRSQEGCAQCHQKIDPWGLPFEEFDAAGLLKKKKVDARSTLPDSTEVAGASALKKYLSTGRIDQVAFSFLKHLASYAIGRSLTFNELEYLKKEGKKELGGGAYRMKDCVRFVIESPMFMEK
ncbi:MAG: DUF1592 domain-containing protein, partial [Planctomycetota bacterium]|nr:DUF1592 domain-containing protein [Planctomycetota bacterium]